MNAIILFLSASQKDFIVGTSLLIIGIIMASVFLGLYLFLKNRRKNNNFAKINRESDTVWEFTKKNFLIFLILFFCIVFIAGIVMMVS